MEYIWLYEVGSENKCSYFGPAGTQEELKEIQQLISGFSGIRRESCP